MFIDLQAVAVSCFLLQVSLDDLLSMAASLEACSEHPLAAAVLQFAEAHLAPSKDTFDADLTAGLQQLEDSNEDSALLSSPVQGHQRPATPSSRNWVQAATDVEIVEGEQQATFCTQVVLVVQYQHQLCGLFRRITDASLLLFWRCLLCVCCKQVVLTMCV